MSPEWKTSGWGIGRHKLRSHLLLSVAVFVITVSSPAAAEPPAQLSAGDVFGLIFGHSVSGPIRLQATCAAEIEACWSARGLTKENMDQVSDACWEESRKCPKVCKDEYFSRRMAGMDSLESDPLFLGRRREDNSCVPGVDELTHPLGKVKANDSAVRVTVMVGGLPAVAEVDATPVDDQGREPQRTTSSPNYTAGNAFNSTPEPISLYLPAGRYRLRIKSPDRFYHPNQVFPDQVELITVESGKTLDKAYTFEMGRLLVQAQDQDGKPVAVMLTIKRLEPSGRNQSIALDTRLLVGKYRLVAKAVESRREKVYDIEIKVDQTVTKLIAFDSGPTD